MKYWVSIIFLYIKIIASFLVNLITSKIYHEAAISRDHSYSYFPGGCFLVLKFAVPDGGEGDHP